MVSDDVRQDIPSAKAKHNLFLHLRDWPTWHLHHFGIPRNVKKEAKHLGLPLIYSGNSRQVPTLRIDYTTNSL